MQSDAIPVACVPQALSREERDRARDLRRELAAATVETRSLPSGYSYRYRADADADVFRKAAEWVTLERRCCPFLTFTLRWGQGQAAPWLDLTGPAGTREFLRAEMPELPRE